MFRVAHEKKVKRFGLNLVYGRQPAILIEIVHFKPKKPSLFGETLETLTDAVEAAGFPRFRADQSMEWLYKKRVESWDAMTNLPKSFREWLAGKYILHPTRPLLDKRADDVTRKFLLKLEDGLLIETVLIRAPQTGVGLERSRKTICVSVQVGCAYGCKFCASGLAGFKRNLLSAEVVSQLMYVCRLEDGDTERAEAAIASFDNIVFMGMGEPLANYDTLVRTIRILNAEWGLNFGARRITVSTSGLVPQILKLADEGLPVRLAISLHGATNAVRDKIMPINKRYPLERLISAAKAFKEKHGRMLTLEFILIENINDSIEQACELAKIAKRLHAHVNCIPYNKVDGLKWSRPTVRRQIAFVDHLRKSGVSTTIRREKGHEISAACGQLRLKTEASS